MINTDLPVVSQVSFEDWLKSHSRFDDPQYAGLVEDPEAKIRLHITRYLADRHGYKAYGSNWWPLQEQEKIGIGIITLDNGTDIVFLEVVGDFLRELQGYANIVQASKDFS